MFSSRQRVDFPLKHFQAKRALVRVKKMPEGKEQEPRSDFIGSEKARERTSPAPRPQRRESRSAIGAAALSRGNSDAMRAGFMAFAASLDMVAIVLVAAMAEFAYHRTFYEGAIPIDVAMRFAALVAIIHVTPNLVRGFYGFHHYLRRQGPGPRLFENWTLAFLGALAFVFVTKSGDAVSRGSALLFYGAGGLALLGADFLMRVIAKKAAASRDMFLRRIFLVGYDEDINAFYDRCLPAAHGVKIVRSAVLRGPGTIRDDLRLAAAAARIFRPDDIFILTPWHESETIEACVDAFMRVPASIHMGPERVLDRFSDAHIARIGAIASLRLVRPPLNFVEVSLKRLFDLVAASLIMLLLSPLLLVVALAIKLDSRGPVLFVQRRYGFNQEPFRIFKFRSMTTMEDHAGLRQATREDPRVTRVGRFIRRANIDELPQLLNVLRGEMSLVGPRPHIMSHDHMFERSIAPAARRHNVRPGITGWAQVNGYRGEIDTDEKLRSRSNTTSITSTTGRSGSTCASC